MAATKQHCLPSCDGDRMPREWVVGKEKDAEECMASIKHLNFYATSLQDHLKYVGFRVPCRLQWQKDMET